MTLQAEAKRQSEVLALKRAILVERKARYPDFQGRQSTFSQFMRKTADRLSRSEPKEPKWSTIRGFFYQYPNLDVATRISIVRRVEEMLDEPESESVASSAKNAYVEQAITRQSRSTASKDAEKTATSKASATSIMPEANPAIAEPQQITLNYEERLNEAEDGEVEIDIKAKKEQAKSSKNQKEEKQTEKESGKTKDKVFHARSGHPAEIDVQFIKGVGPKMAKLLNNLNIFTAQDLIRHYPRHHLDFQNRLMIGQVKPGQEVTIFGTIRSTSAFQSKKSNISIVTIVIHDGTGGITVSRFIGGKSNKFLLDRLKDQYPKGTQVMASGIVEFDRFQKRLKLKNAELELLGEVGEVDEDKELLHTGRLVPVYPLTEGLSLRYLRNIIHNALEAYGENIVDTLPSQIQRHFELIGLSSALRSIHFPEDVESKELARRRLVFDELFAIQLQLAYKRNLQATDAAQSLPMVQSGLVERFLKTLPFKLTGAQDRVFGEIARDMSSNKAMQRLVQGDVGSGKTVVALMSLLIAVENGFQGAMMAPTEILAEQHYRQFERFLAPLGLRVGIFLGKHGKAERRQLQQDLLSGQINIAVGTHALIQEGVEFQNLGLIIIDEQHRFGVKQRAQLKAKGQNPQLLTMTATPIPRTLALTLHGDLDISEIDEMPPGRKPIQTKIVSPGQKRPLFGFLREQVLTGRQVYVVFPLIEESETLAAKAATAEYEKLKTHVFPEFRLGLMHGKLKPQEKDEVMEKFRNREFDMLISTTVIEVGVDVPNATVMVIENADRFGLAQLHQLRGRVGRGSEQSYCFLIADVKSESTRQRLGVLEATNDGFVVAEKDLEIRGPGEFLGTRQSGLPDLCLADLIADATILEQARKAAIGLIKSNADLSKYPELKEQVQKRLQTLAAEYINAG
jgi:ATP-dependent DNA helicase RecG